MDTVYVVTARNHNSDMLVRVFSTIEKAELFMIQLREYLWQEIDFHSCVIDINC